MGEKGWGSGYVWERLELKLRDRQGQGHIICFAKKFGLDVSSRQPL